MRITLTVTAGAKNGLSKSFDQAYIGLGRHPQSDLQFHPEQDLDASTRHAAILKAGETWTVRDLGSANGTFVNGEKVTADRRLHTGDLIRLGGSGPVVAVEVQGEAAPAAAATRVSGEGHSPVMGSNTTARVKVEVAKQTQKLRRVTSVLFGLLIVVAGGYFWQKATFERKLAEMQQEMSHTLDSLQNEMRQVTVRFEGMRGALDSASKVTEQLRAQVNAGGDQATMQLLRQQLAQAVQRQRGIAAAAGLDAAQVNRVAGNAVALVIVRFPGGGRFSGTAFAVRTDGSGADLITNRHVVTSESGEDPVEIGVMFNGSNQFFRATLVKKHPSQGVDLALIRVNIRGGVDVTLTVNDHSPEVGQPVLAIGFPMGTDLAGFDDLARTGAVASLTAGSLSRVTPGLIQVDGYGATGASGSPYLDAQGRVIGVLYGGERESNGRIVYAVPAARIAELF